MNFQEKHTLNETAREVVRLRDRIVALEAIVAELARPKVGRPSAAQRKVRELMEAANG